MNLENENILLIDRSMSVGGSAKVVIQICEMLNDRVNKFVVCSRGGVYVEYLEQIGVKHYTIPDISHLNPKNMLAIMATLKKIVREENISIIHTHHRMAAFYVSLLKLHKKCQLFNTSHNTFYNKIALTKFAYKHFNLIACGEMVKKNLNEVFGLDNVTVVTNAIHPFGGEIVEDSMIKAMHDDGAFIIGNIGRLSEQKGMEYFVRAIPDIVKKYQNVRFLIVGEGEEENKLRKLANELLVEKYLFFLGYRNDIQNLIAQIDLVVLSSLWEGFPLTPIEAFSVGKTIIATAVDGTVEIVRDGENGLLINSKNSEQIAEKVIWIMDNPIEKENMEKNALRCYKDEFSMDKFADDYANCYLRTREE